MTRFTNIKHYKKDFVKAFYGKLGKSSGLNPGVLWPRKEELTYLKQYDAAFSFNLDRLISDNKLKKQEALQKRLDREREVLDNLKKLPAEMKEFFDKIDEKKREKEEWTRQREALVEEVREILGYRAKPSDPKFQEALAKKEEEEIKIKKKEAKKKREDAKLEDLIWFPCGAAQHWPVILID